MVQGGGGWCREVEDGAGRWRMVQGGGGWCREVYQFLNWHKNKLSDAHLCAIKRMCAMLCTTYAMLSVYLHNLKAHVKPERYSCVRRV